MSQKIFIVEGRQFRTEADYNRARKDKLIIDRIKSTADFQNLKQLEQLREALKSHKYPFYTLLGQDFADEVEEAYKKLKDSGSKSGNGKKTTGKPMKKPAEAAAVLEPYVQEELKRQEKKRKWLVFLCSCVAVGCLGYFAVYSYYDYKTSQSYEALNALKEKPAVSNGEKPAETPVIHYTQDGKEPPEVLEEYKNLLNKNKRLIGWLKIDDTNINYPVMQTNNNEYYLDHNLNQEYDKNGSIFMDKDCDVLKPSTNFILYGHHMKSGKMFGDLDLYSSEEYYRKHRYIEFDTIYEKGTYEVMYVFRTQVYKEEEIAFKYYQFIDALSDTEFDSYMQEMADMSMYDTGVTAEYGDQLLTLSTCDYVVQDGRFVVVAKKVEEYE